MNPRFSQMKTNSLTQCDSILMIVWIIRQIMSLLLWNFKALENTCFINEDKRCLTTFYPFYFTYMKSRKERLGCLESLLPCMYATAPLTLLTVSRALTSFKGRASWSSFEFQTSEYFQFHHFFYVGLNITVHKMIRIPCPGCKNYTGNPRT